ncbi:MAG: hypothetical protein IJH44_08330 [Solobacterium sp.]|nr:hypothetical protein [Solobacterium sp.]
MTNRPHSRKRGEATSSGSVNRRNEGLNSDRVGKDSGRTGSNTLNNGREEARQERRETFERKTEQTPVQRGMMGGGPSYGRRRGGGGGGFIRIIIFILLVLLVMNMFGSCGSGSGSGSAAVTPAPTPAVQTPAPAQPSGNVLHGYNPPVTTYTQVDSQEINTASVSGVRDKFTQLKGNGQDTVTIMIYMCGSDLETNYGMATSDLNEMLYADQADNVNIIVETGGARKWNNSVISNQVNERYKIMSGRQIARLATLDDRVMSDPGNLTDFIRFSSQNFPADRYMLILWDHGGGSVTGYCHDQKHTGVTMTVPKIAKALADSGIKFDVVGFDACLMANAETAVAVAPYADYLIASEETEPGTGWYYTNWLSRLAANTSIPTVELGKQIIDDFIIQSARTSSRDKTSLSIVDLAEFDATVPTALKNFAVSINTNIEQENYQPIADARYVTKEFAQSTRIDQIDIVHFCQNINSPESRALAEAVQSCVKYNRTNNMNNAYGMSIYFPYSSLKSVSVMSGIYENIGLSEYGSAVRSFAGVQASGQMVTGAGQNNLFNILGGSGSYSGSSTQTISSQDIMNLLLGTAPAPQQSSSYGNSLNSLLGGGGSAVTPEDIMLQLISGMLSNRANVVDTSELELTEVNGHKVVALSDETWALIRSIEQSVFVDDGTGYIDMGLDNVFEFDDDGNLLAEYDGNWMSLDDNPVAYYMISDEYVDDDNYRTTGYVPCLVNDQKAHLLIEFTPENPDGVVYGVQNVYEDGVEARIYQLVVDDEEHDADVVTFIADYYDYQNNFDDVYEISDPIPYDGELTVGTFHIAGQGTMFGYRLTDIYNTELRTPMQAYSE